MRYIFLVFMLTFLCNQVFAAHPLITDDTGTQGKGKFQIELNSEFNNDKETEQDITTDETSNEIATIISYGIKDHIDIVLGIPYQANQLKEDDSITSDDKGLSDISIESKWRFYDKNGLTFAIKPGFAFPTGDENKGLGNGKISRSLTFITTKEINKTVIHINLFYTHNDFDLKEDKEANRKDIWHASLASQISATEQLDLVANIGIESNPDKISNVHPSFILGGVIYSIKENFDVDLGIKGGLNKPETDSTFLAGFAYRF